MVSTDASLFQQLSSRSRTGHRLHGQLHNLRETSIALRKCLQYSITQTALGPVVFNGNDLITSVLCRDEQGLLIDWLHRVGIDHTNSDALALQLLIRRQRLMNGDTSCNNRSLVIV